MRHNALFVGGTDTGIGKTYACRALADALSAHGTVSYMKPVQTGCARRLDGGLEAPDFDYVMAGNATQTAGYDDHVPYRFALACSPHLAAREALVAMDFANIASSLDRVSESAEVTLVEGAGGLFVPFGEDRFTLDLVIHLDLAVVLVTSPRLGTLNHTFLSVAALRERRIPLVGIVYDNAAGQARDLIYNDNLDTIRSVVAPLPVLELDHDVHEGPAVREFCDAILKRIR